MLVRKLSISGIDAQDHILIAARTADGREIEAYVQLALKTKTKWFTSVKCP